MLKEFKAFAMRGNVVDLAVGIVIGVAFGAIVSGFVDEIMMPLIGMATGGTDFSNMFVLLRQGTPPPPYASLAAAKEAGAVVMGYGAFINAVVNFVIIAFALFLIVKTMNSLKRAEEAAPLVPTKEELLLTEIRDLLARR